MFWPASWSRSGPSVVRSRRSSASSTANPVSVSTGPTRSPTSASATASKYSPYDGVVGADPAEDPSRGGGEVVADLGGDGGELLAALDPADGRLGLLARRVELLVGRLGAGLRIVGQGVHQDQLGANPFGERVPLGDARRRSRRRRPRRRTHRPGWRARRRPRARWRRRRRGPTSAALIWSICCWMSWSRGPPSWLCSSVTVARGLGDEDAPLDVEVRAVVRRAGDRTRPAGSAPPRSRSTRPRRRSRARARWRPRRRRRSAAGFAAHPASAGDARRSRTGRDRKLIGSWSCGGSAAALAAAGRGEAPS